MNLSEAAAKLAHKRVVRSLQRRRKIMFEQQLYTESGEYIPEAMELFKEYCDEYMQDLTSLQGDEGGEHNTGNSYPRPSFRITSIAYEDIEHINEEGDEEYIYNVGEITYDQMETLARKMGEDYCEQLFWIHLPTIMDILEFPKVRRKEEQHEN